MAVEVVSLTERAYPLSFQPLPKLGENPPGPGLRSQSVGGVGGGGAQGMGLCYERWKERLVGGERFITGAGVQRGSLGDSKQKMSQIRPLPLKCLNLLQS